MSDAAVVSTNWTFPTMVRFGAGRIRELPRVSAGLGMHRPLLVVDPGLGRRSGLEDPAAQVRSPTCPYPPAILPRRVPGLERETGYE